MDESEQLSRLIADIYDAALDPSLWESVLEKVCGFLPGGAAMLGIDDTAKKSVRLVVEWGNDPHFLQLHDNYYTRLNPMTVPTLLYAKPGSVLGSSDLVPYEELIATRFFREWIAPQGMVDALAIIIEKAPTSYAAVIVHRYRKHGRVDDAMKRRASLLAPHFQRAIAIGKLIDLHKVEAATMADALDGLSAGIFLIDSGIRVVQANRRGRTMLKERIHLGETDGRLCALDPAADRMLRNTVGIGGRRRPGRRHQGICDPAQEIQRRAIRCTCSAPDIRLPAFGGGKLLGRCGCFCAEGRSRPAVARRNNRAYLQAHRR